MEIEGFDTIISSLTLAKELHDINKFDIVESQFDDLLCYESYYQNILGVMSSIFTDFSSDFYDDDETEMQSFADDVISNYFVCAWEYGKLHNIHYSKNPLVINAQKEAQRWLNSSCCVDWKLLAYIRSKQAAAKSRLIVRIYNGCGGCCPYDTVAFGLIKLYIWFANNCKELENMKAVRYVSKEDVLPLCMKLESPEVMAA
jgi:hypothetical protein